MSEIVKYEAGDGSSVTLTPESVAQYIVTGNAEAPAREVARFMALCKARRLNPMTGDAYMTVYRGQRGDVSTSVVVSKDYYTRTAASQPGFDGFEAGVVVQARDGSLTERQGSLVAPGETLIGGWAVVFDKGRSHPVRETVALGEYSTGRSLWKAPDQGGKPATMIRKVALVQALREAYPAAYAGLYDAAEMPDRAAPAEPAAPAPVEVAGEVAQGAPQGPTPEDVEERRRWLNDAAERLADAAGMTVSEAKAHIWAGGRHDYRRMSDADWAAYAGGIEDDIATAASEQAGEIVAEG